MSSAVTIAELLASLQESELLLLPNNSAARELRSAYDALQRTRQLAAWQPASALAWARWTNGLYNDLVVSGAETRLLMNAAQEQSLWRDIIHDDPPADALGSTDALASLAASAFRLAASWNATPQLRASAMSEDTRTFAKWAEDFIRRCAKQNCLSSAMLEATLTQHTAAGTLTATATLQLVGFTQLTPAQQFLLDTLQSRGTKIAHLALAGPATKNLHATVLAESPQAERDAAARWIRHTLEAASSSTPLRIALLVPNPAEERAALEAVFREILAPELQSIDTDLSSTPWEFSSGVSLSSLALIADALDILRWASGSLPLQRITALLLSPYLGADRELAAEIDAKLRSAEKLLRPELTLQAFTTLLEKHDSPLPWPRNLATELARAGDLSKPRSFADWMELFRNLIQSAGWPGSTSRQLNAAEFETTRAWDSVLDLVSTLDFAGRRISLATALEALELQASATQFLPPSHTASVQVISPSEAEGTFFDAFLFLHATDENWPPRERTHPLLSWQLQSSLGMPGTAPALASTRARELTSELVSHTGTVLFFIAKEDENGHLRPSPLIGELHLDSLDAATLVAAPPLASPVEFEDFTDDSVLPPLPSTTIRGGARVLQLQAACGFRAFAELRLNATEPATAGIGLDAMQSGNIVHSVLQNLWTKITSQAELAALSLQQRNDMLVLCIEDTLRTERSRPDSHWDDAYLSVIRERLLRLLRPWLDCELARSPFTVIAAELSREIPIGPLTLRVRVDRIDRSQDGNILIDYKTGASARLSQWNAPRPEEPQLPLYSLLFEPDEIKAIAFAKILAGEKLTWLGMQSEAGLLPMKRTEDIFWHMQQWREELTQLAHEFAEGHATVSPKQYPQTCTHCAIRLLCRVNPANLVGLDLEDDEQEENDG